MSLEMFHAKTWFSFFFHENTSNWFLNTATNQLNHVKNNFQIGIITCFLKTNTDKMNEHIIKMKLKTKNVLYFKKWITTHGFHDVFRSLSKFIILNWINVRDVFSNLILQVKERLMSCVTILSYNFSILNSDWY